MDWLTRRILGEAIAGQHPLPRWLWIPMASRRRKVERPELAHGTLAVLEDQDGPVISLQPRL
jgi:hypothetical protein